MRQFVKAAFLTIILAVLNGCGTTPLPVPAPSVYPYTRNINSVAQAPPGHFDIVIKCITSNLEENAGLKIAGVIAEEGESPYVFAVPGKSGGLLVMRIKELGVDNPAAGIRLTLLIRVFDALGENIYTRSVTGISEVDAPLNQPPDIEKALVVVTKDILRQYAKDPTLRPLIMKYKIGSLLKFI